MAFTLIVSSISVLGVVLCLLFFPKLRVGKVAISSFYLPPLCGLLLLLCFGALPFRSYMDGLLSNGGMNPLEILALFFGMAFISSILDETGFFSFLASKAVLKAKGSQLSLFCLLYLLCSLLTMFTSNDIVIITFTPFILCFAKEAKINPLPYLLSEFVAANTWSSLFIFGNPTNVYLASIFHLDFVSYLSGMYLPTLIAGIISFLLMFLLFRRSLKEPLSIEQEEVTVKDPLILWVSLSILLGVTILMAISSFVSLPMWLFALGGAILLLMFLLVYSLCHKERSRILLEGAKKLPFSLAPFLLSMFGIVMALSECGFSSLVVSSFSSFDPTWGYGLSSFALSNLMNNLPMSVFFADLLSFSNTGIRPLFAVILASNVGALWTPIGALAGILWMRMLKERGVSFSFMKFCLYGSIVGIPTFFLSLFSLFLVC